MQFEAPALNFFALQVEFGDTRQECSNIVVRSQDPEVFLPPADASVELHPNEFRGIVSNP